MNARSRHILRDTSGASIVIALVFFLICAIIGSVVVTAASVEAKSVQTHKELQQAEFTMGSAAQTIGYDLDMAQLTVVEGTQGDTVSLGEHNLSQFGERLWTDYGSTILDARKNGKQYAPAEKLTIKQGDTKVYGQLVIDRDLNITIDLSLDENLDPTSPYNMTVSIQCVPTYDAAGTLKSFTYERAVIAKTSGEGTV